VSEARSDSGATDHDDRPRVALGTGGSRGIGAEIVCELARVGTRVCFTYRADDRAANTVVQRTVETGVPYGDVLAVQADVTDEVAMGKAFDLAESLGRLEVLVNNAGSTGRIATFVGGTNDETRRVLEVNLMAPIMVSRLAVRRWLGDGQDRCIVNVSSAAATLGAPGEYIPYAAAKAGVDTLTMGLAKELAPMGVRVNAVSPGTTNTEIHAAAGQPDRAARVAARIPFGRAGEPREVAKAAVWLASQEASYVSGAVLRVAGGL
jgi:NAD(P)-dependent dehydrogenase (short-subunit alcohol dehydrogenase family)